MNFFILKLTFRHWKIILGSAAFMALLMVLLTVNMPKIYESTASIFTAISMGDGMVEGRPDPSVQTTLYDNMTHIITGRETLKEVGLRLLAMHLTMKRSDQRIISAKHLEALQKNVPPDIKNLIGKTDSVTYLNLKEIADQHIFLIQTLNLPQVPYYSYAALSTVSVNRIGNSDMISLVYACNDAGVSQKTLEILIDVCIRNYRNIRESQINKKVAFFEEQFQQAQAKLKHAETEEEQFAKKYGTTDLAVQSGMAPQEITNQIQKEQGILQAIGTDIRQIEWQWGAQSQSLKRTDISFKVDQLNKLLDQLITAELTGAPPARITRLRTEVNQLKADLTNDLTEYMAPVTSVTEYVNKMAAYAGSKTRIKVLENRKASIARLSGKPPLPADTLKRIQRDIDLYEREFQTATDNLNESRRQQQEQKLSSAVQALDQPNFPLTAKAGKRHLIILLGALLGFVVSTSVFLVRAFFNNHIQTPQRAEKATGLTTAGVVPNTKKLQALKNASQITTGLSDAILKNLNMTDHRSDQIRILMISTRAEEGKTLISNMLCERLIDKGRKCLVVMPYMDSGSWSVVSYKANSFFYQARAEDIAPIEKMNEADILIIELPSLMTNDYPVDLIKQFNIAFLVCKANREWTSADQTALDNFVKISGIKPQIILNDVELDLVKEILGKIN